MVARSGMGDVITRLREMTYTGTADYTVAGVTYWIDDQLQRVLDRHSAKVKIQMSHIYEVVNNATGVMDFSWGDDELEHAESGTAVWRVTNSSGSVIGTANYTVNYEARRIRFSTAQTGLLYLESVAYAMEETAVEVWDMKAGHVAHRFDLQTDNHRMMRNQLVNEYRKEADKWRKRVPARQVRLSREDSWW